MEAVERHLPEILPYTISAYGSATNLKFGQYNISSEEGAQQGDPLGPLYFCIGIHDILSTMQSDIAYAYLDDMVLAGDVYSGKRLSQTRN